MKHLSPDHRHIDAGGFRLRVHSWHPPEARTRPVLALHGFGTDGYRTFRHLADPLTRHGVSLHALDLLGFGGSDKPDPYEYSLRRYAALHRAALDALGLRQPVLMGHSMGAKIAAVTAALHPDAVSGLVLLNAGGFSRAGRLLPFVGGLGLTQWLFRQNWFFHRLLPRTPLGPVFASATSRAEYVRLRHSHAALDLDATGLRRLLPTFPGPVLILWGAADTLLPPSVARRTAATFANAHLHLLPDAGHAPMKDQPEATAAAITRFLNQDIPRPGDPAGA